MQPVERGVVGPWMLVACAVVYAATGTGCAVDGPEVVPGRLPWGVTRVDLNGDGHRDVVIRSWRENHNAHGFSVYDVFVWKGKALHRVVLPEPAGRGYALSLISVQGADCVLRDVYLVRRRGRAMLMLAERPLGQGYAAAEPVTFSLLRVEESREEVPGMPRFVLRAAEEKRTARPYCDVHEALRAEAGTGFSGAGCRSGRCRRRVR